ncbi:glycosyltransferase [bacterium]|nr:glycosyltransferase [bacterium]
MKTLVIDAIFFQINEWSGIAKYWLTLLKELDIYLLNNQSLTVYVLVRGPSRCIRNHHFKNIQILPISYFDSICALSDFEELGIICESLNADYFISTYYTLAPNIKNIGMAYDFIPEAMSAMQEPIWKVKQIYMSKIKACISISQSTSRLASIFYPNLVSDSRLIMYPPFSSDEYRNIDYSEKQSFRDKYDIKYPYAAVIGHRGSYKNFNLLTEALHSRSVQENKLFAGIVVTSGEDLTNDEIALFQNHFKFGIKRLRLESNEIPIFLNQAECLFYPSLHEGFGYPVAEAFLQSCPVITTGATSIGEILEQAESNDYIKILGYDSKEALESIIKLLHCNRRVSLSTKERTKDEYCTNKADEFVKILSYAAHEASTPNLLDLKECIALDGLIA